MMYLSSHKATRWVGSLVVLFSSALVGADVKVHALFGHGTVLQQGMEVPVWGTAQAGETVTVSIAGQEKKTTADADGKWMVRLENLTATPNQTGQQMVISGSNTLIINDVLIGEVWLCAGQSNMALTVAKSANAHEEIATANYPMIRHIKVMPLQTDSVPMLDITGQWRPAIPQHVAHFSATAYYFARRLHHELGIPIGLINCSKGSTSAAAWTSKLALLEKLPQYAKPYADLVEPGDILKEKVQAYEKYRENYDQKLTELYTLEDDMDAAAAIASPIHDDSAWQTMAVPGDWESAGMKDTDGMVWFRKSIVVPAKWAGKKLILSLGPVDEVDVTFFNGIEVGRTGQMRGGNVTQANKPRVYEVPEELVKEGTNTIAVRVIDSRNNGGIHGGKAKDIFIRLAVGSDKEVLPLAGEWRYKLEFQLPLLEHSPANNRLPTVLFNGLIHPLIPYAIRGAIWYQGEADVGREEEYRTLLPTLIQDWRARWGQGDFPFYIVQLAGYRVQDTRPSINTPWPNFREAQARIASSVPNSGLALAIDIGEADIHPTNKQDVGNRLALITMAKDYAKDVVYQGPTFKNMTIQGHEAHITFDNIQGGLSFKGDVNAGFAIAGESGEFVWGDARLQGDTVIVSSKAVEKPVSVRYAWSNMPRLTLYNGHALPATPFATDRME